MRRAEGACAVWPTETDPGFRSGLTDSGTSAKVTTVRKEFLRTIIYGTSDQGAIGNVSRLALAFAIFALCVEFRSFRTVLVSASQERWGTSKVGGGTRGFTSIWSSDNRPRQSELPPAE